LHRDRQRIDGLAAARGRPQGHALLAAEFAHHGAPALRRLSGPGHRHHAARPGNPESQKRLNEIYVKHTGQTFKAIEDALERDKLLTAEMAATSVLWTR